MKTCIEVKQFVNISRNNSCVMLPTYAERLVPYGKHSRSKLCVKGNDLFSLTIAFEYSAAIKVGKAKTVMLFINPKVVYPDMVKIARKKDTVIYGKIADN